MKKLSILTALFLMLSINSVYSQGVGINDDGSNPDGSAILDVKSTTKGLLFPRMTLVQMRAISSPVAGLQIFNTTNGCMYYYNGTNWIDLQVCDCGTLTDIDGNVYQAVKIGDQCWMAEDLKVGTYPNGDAIPYIDDNATWGVLADNNTSDAYTVYDDDNNDGVVDIANPDYGYLYSYAAAIGDNWARDNNANQGVCPDGWHLPSDAEWTELTDYLGGTSVAGGKLKETGTTHWNSPNTGATNESGFSALPGGYRSYLNGAFGGVGSNVGYWWSATEYSSYNAWTRGLYYATADVYRFNYYKSSGFSVRCLKD
jgi:uncharacterized protein (TIGR02145 family)